MSLAAPSTTKIDATPFSIAVVAARYNAEDVESLLTQVVSVLRAAGVADARLKVERVPGSNELPVAAQALARHKHFDAIVALGVLIRGDTIHYELIADAVTHGLQTVALDTRIPVINGVVVAENAEQAAARCRGQINRGAEFAQAALEMAALKRRLS